MKLVSTEKECFMHLLDHKHTSASRLARTSFFCPLCQKCIGDRYKIVDDFSCASIDDIHNFGFLRLKMPSSTPENRIYHIVVNGLQDTDIEIIAPGHEKYEESIVRWSEAAEKKAVSCVL